jgi:hypothetical protein
MRENGNSALPVRNHTYILKDKQKKYIYLDIIDGSNLTL